MTGLELRKLKVVWDFAVLSGGQLLAKFLGFFAFAYLARALGPDAYGSVEYGLALSAFFAMFIDAGLGPIGVRELTQGKATPAAITANVAVARLGLTLVSIPLMMLVASSSAQGAKHQSLMWLFALSLLASPWRLDWLLQAKEMMARASIVQLVRMAGFMAVVVVLVRRPEDVTNVGWAELTAAGAAAVYYLGVQHFSITPVSLRCTRQGLRELLREGLPVGGSQLIAALNMYAPTFLVGILVGSAETAWFGASHRVVISLSIFSVIYHFNLYPTLTRRLAGKDEDLGAMIRASFRVVGWVSIGGALLLTLFGRTLLELAFGKRFSGALPAFQVLVWFLPISLLSGHARWLLVAGARQVFVLVGQAACAVVTLIAGLTLVHRYGAVGASAAMVIAALVLWIVTHYFAAKAVRALPGLSSTLKPGLWALAVGAAAFLWGREPWLTTALGGAVFFGLAPLVDRRLLPDLRLLAQVKSDAAPRPTGEEPG